MRSEKETKVIWNENDSMINELNLIVVPLGVSLSRIWIYSGPQ